MIQIKDIEIFILLVEAGNFSQAARKLNVSPTAISKSIKKFEKELGISLFRRSTRHVLLTDNAKLIYQNAQRVIANLSEMKNMAAILQTEPFGVLRISSPISIANYILMPLLAKYLLAHPQISVELDLQDHKILNMDKENIDILFGRTMNAVLKQEENVIAVKLFETKNILCASQAYIKTHGLPKKISDLNNHAYIYHKLRTEDKFVEFCRQHNVQPKTRLVVTSTEALAQAIEMQVGIGLCPQYLINKLGTKTKFVTLEKIYQDEPITLYMFFRKTRYNERKIVEFKEFLAKNNNWFKTLIL